MSTEPTPQRAHGTLFHTRIADPRGDQLLPAGLGPGTEDDYLPLTTAALRAVSEVTDRALRRLRSIGPDEPLLPWGDVPHILHREPVPLHLFRERVRHGRGG